MWLRTDSLKEKIYQLRTIEIPRKRMTYQWRVHGVLPVHSFKSSQGFIGDLFIWNKCVFSRVEMYSLVCICFDGSVRVIVWYSWEVSLMYQMKSVLSNRMGHYYVNTLLSAFIFPTQIISNHHVKILTYIFCYYRFFEI